MTLVENPSLNQSGNLKRHIKTHYEGQRNYNCDSCGKSFSESSSLKQHLNSIHEGQNNYKCDFCGKSFNESGNLNGHIKARTKKSQV